MKIYIKFLTSIFFKSFLYVSLVMFSLVFILNMLTELEFFKEIDVGINYTRSKNNQYAYFLEGYDNEWNYVENTRSATYKNIPAGDYTFMVKSSNNDGIWNNTPATLKIKIQPAWWSTKTAIISYCLLLLLLGYLILHTLKE